MKPWEIDEKIKDNYVKINELRAKMNELNAHNEKLYSDKKLAIYDVVLDFVAVGDIIVFDSTCRPFKKSDRIEVLKKNKKSVVIKLLERSNTKYDFNANPKRWIEVTYPNKTERIKYEQFGKAVYSIKSYRDQIESVTKRNDVLESILN